MSLLNISASSWGNAQSEEHGQGAITEDTNHLFPGLSLIAHAIGHAGTEATCTDEPLQLLLRYHLQRGQKELTSAMHD